MAELKAAPLTLSQVLSNCASITPDARAHCLKTTMRDLGLQPIGCSSAAKMIALTPNRHTTGVPPAGAVVLWGGGSHGFGHIAVSAGDGYCWTVDWVPGLHQTKVAISAINRSWTTLSYAGWATNYGGIYRLDIADGERRATVAKELPTLRLRRFNDSRAKEMSQPRDVRHHPVTVATAEHALKKLGFNPGPVDGHYGTGTDRAVRAFQASLNNAADGELGPKQWARLAKLSGLFVPSA